MPGSPAVQGILLSFDSEKGNSRQDAGIKKKGKYENKEEQIQQFPLFSEGCSLYFCPAVYHLLCNFLDLSADFFICDVNGRYRSNFKGIRGT